MPRFIFVALTIACLGLPAAAFAQQSPPDLFSDTPVCSKLVNASGFTIYGDIQTMKVEKWGSDEIIHYKSNFRLGKDESTQICSKGPFFEGQRLLLKLRSLMPLFECKTRLGQPITINATPKKEGVGYDWSATCF